MKNSNWHGGKGSGRRSSQDDSKYADNWDKIFGKNKSSCQELSEELGIADYDDDGVFKPTTERKDED